LSWLRFSFLIFFFKTLFIATVFSRIVFFCFFYDFLSKLSFFLFYFLILSWLKITFIICEESTVTFLENYYGLLQYFFSTWFFLYFVKFFPKIVFVNFFLKKY
jgi:hypothetical protein